jgi:hypothetical protein
MRSLVGVFALNLVFLVAGSGVLWAIRGWRNWTEYVRLVGFAYLLGVGVEGVLATLVLVAGGGVGVAFVLVSAALVTAAAVGFASWRGRAEPVWRSSEPRREPAVLLGIGMAVLALVALEALFRVARLQGVAGWDGWAFWTPKAESVYRFNGLNADDLRTFFAPMYPMLVPALQAMDFHFMGSVDTVTLAVQYWFLLVGFVLSLAGLLRPYVPLWLLWPFLALLCVMPELDGRALHTMGDLPLDYFFVTSALCLALWLIDREPWLLASFGILLAAALAIKREGQMLAACLVVAALLATWRERRVWLPIVGAAAAAYLVNLPWRIWWSAHDFPSDAPPLGLRELPSHADRAWPGFRQVVDLLFSYDMWLLAVPLAILAACLLLTRRRYELPILYLLTTVFGVAGFTWIVWSFPEFGLTLHDVRPTPIPRAIGALVLLAVAFTPLLLARSLEASDPSESARA